MKTYEAHGFVAVVIPFFADTWLPEEYGVACGSNVTYSNSNTNRFPGECVRDYKEVYVNTTNGRTPLYYCVRVSHNGKDVRQLCDPTTDTVTHQGAMTGAVRAAVEEMWNDLKRGHSGFRLQIPGNRPHLKGRLVGWEYAFDAQVHQR